MSAIDYDSSSTSAPFVSSSDTPWDIVSVHLANSMDLVSQVLDGDIRPEGKLTLATIAQAQANLALVEVMKQILQEIRSYTYRDNN